MKKRLALYIFFNPLLITSFGQRDSIFVWAENGLTFRSSADQNGKKLDVIPFGEGVKLLKDSVYHPPFTSKIKLETYILCKEGFEVEGSYVKVSYKGQTGYVYSGFTSPIKPKGKEFITYEDHFSKQFGKPTKVKDHLESGQSIWYHYKNGYAINYRSDEEGRMVEYFITLEKASVSEAFLLVNQFETVRCVHKSEEYLLARPVLFYEFHSGNENVSEGHITITKYTDRVVIQIQQDWE